MLQIIDSFLNKGFRGDRCKTLLKLVTSRIKLLRNKRQVQIKQARKELAQLLETGQESSACIRVEHIIREQNIMEAYDMLELFCELLIVRMPIIEMQRVCPLDLQEAVSSLIFAAPRSSDLTELLQVQNMFTIKYGKEFVAGATQLLPGCKVNHTIIEKLSARAPSTATKVSLMREISEEHNVDWDSKTMELDLAKMREDLLEGSSQFVSASESQVLLMEGNNDGVPDHILPSKMESMNQPQAPVKEAEHINVSAPLFARQVEANTHTSHNGELGPFPEERPFLIKSILGNAMQVGQKIVTFMNSNTTEMANSPARFYSPPRESTIAQSSGFSEDTLLQRGHSRTKSEGSADLEAIIEAAETAANSAESAAQACRTAAEMARSKLLSKSLSCKGTSSFSFPSSETTSQEKDSVVKSKPYDDYDWTQTGRDSEEKLNPSHDDNFSWLQQEKDIEMKPTPLHDAEYDWTRQEPGVNTSRDSASGDDYVWMVHNEKQEHWKEDAYDRKGQIEGYDMTWHAYKQMKDRSPESLPFEMHKDDSNFKTDYHDNVKVNFDKKEGEHSVNIDPSNHLRQPNRLPSLDDDPYNTYPNLFSGS